MKKILLILAILFIILLASLLFFKKTTNLPVTEDMTQTPTTTEEILVDESNLRTLVVKHQYKDGKHIFMGDVEVPTPCNQLSVTVKDTSNPALKRIDIKIGEQEGTCAQVVTIKTFKVEYQGPEDLEFEAYIEDEKMRLNRFDLAPDVDIDEFEMFIKG